MGEAATTTAAPGSLRNLFEPRAVAVVGASASPDKAGHQLMRALGCFPGEVLPVNPRGGEVAGRQAYASVRELPVTPELAMVAVPPPALPGALRDCAEAGVGAAVVCTGGLAESGPEGSAIQDELGRIADETGIRVLGPNTSGFLRPGAQLFASFVAAARSIRAGGLAIVAQSGGVNHALAFLAAGEGLGVRLAVGLGNAVRTGFADVIEHLRGDPGVDAIALHLEGVADGRALFEAVERAVVRVPVVALKAGRSDVAELARSHTGALTGEWRLTRAALAQAGAVIVEDTTELIDAARALGSARLPPSADPGVGIVSGQAGPALVMVDDLRSSGVRTPELREKTRTRLAELLPPITYQRNPVDTGRPSPSFPEVLRLVADDPGVDALGVYQLHEPEAADPRAFLAALERRRVSAVLATAGPEHELAAVREAGTAMRIPVYLTPERAARGLRSLTVDARARDRRRRIGECPPASGGRRERTRRRRPPPAGPRPGGDVRPLNENDAKGLLEAAGIQTPARAACATREEALGALERVGTPAVVKLLDREQQHKSEAGGVHLGVRDRYELERALDAIDRTAPRPGEGYLIEQAAGRGPELIAGARVDAAFGPTVLLGAGGLLAEAIEDVSIRLAPLAAAEAAEMLADLRGQRAFEGFRGAPAVDPAELTGVLLALSRLITETDGGLVEIDVNPLRVTAEGLVALDAVAFAADAGDRAAGLGGDRAVGRGRTGSADG